LFLIPIQLTFIPQLSSVKLNDETQEISLY